ncbi:GNAT family N-acetyltransferase [Staphylococcus auricularis]|uniref:GNAT family N-acetyltransferase n=1 Tax=Staphylococcus auricularis TaxID=29379 RepID=UPI001245DE58|nr:GNAT family N-acetyltransferase [Staphylococcus auricularis]
MSFRIRVAEPKDAEALHALMHEAFTSLREMGIDWSSVNADLDMVRRNMEKGTVFVLEQEGKIISTITVRYPWIGQRRNSIYPFLWWFATDPEYGGQGYGSELLTFVEETYLRDTLKVPAVTLGTSAKTHPWLLKIYQHRGYVVYHERERDDGDINAFMYKVLIPDRFDKEVLGTPPPKKRKS